MLSRLRPTLAILLLAFLPVSSHSQTPVKPEVYRAFEMSANERKQGESAYLRAVDAWHTPETAEILSGYIDRIEQLEKQIEVKE